MLVSFIKKIPPPIKQFAGHIPRQRPYRGRLALLWRQGTERSEKGEKGKGTSVFQNPCRFLQVYSETFSDLNAVKQKQTTTSFKKRGQSA